MKIVEKNPEKKKEELVLKEKRAVDSEERKLYLERVQKDKRFQRYIVDDILRANLDKLSSLDNIPSRDMKSADEGWAAVLTAKASKIVLEKMLQEILN